MKKSTYYIWCTSSVNSSTPVEIIHGTEAEVKKALKDYLSAGTGSYVATKK
jgi:hypothetical protein